MESNGLKILQIIWSICQTGYCKVSHTHFIPWKHHETPHGLKIEMPENWYLWRIRRWASDKRLKVKLKNDFMRPLRLVYYFYRPELLLENTLIEALVQTTPGVEIIVNSISCAVLSLITAKFVLALGKTGSKYEVSFQFLQIIYRWLIHKGRRYREFEPKVWNFT